MGCILLSNSSSFTYSVIAFYTSTRFITIIVRLVVVVTCLKSYKLNTRCYRDLIKSYDYHLVEFLLFLAGK